MRYSVYVMSMILSGVLICFGATLIPESKAGQPQPVKKARKFKKKGKKKGKNKGKDKNTDKEKKKEEKEAPPIMNSLNKVLPPYDNHPWEETIEVDCKVFYKAKKKGKVLAVGVFVEEQGYGGKIKMAVGVKCGGRLIGVEIVKHMETVDFGTKALDPQWRAQFKGKKLSSGVWEVKKDNPDGIIDEITGATITSRAITKGVAGVLEIFEENKKDICK